MRELFRNDYYIITLDEERRVLCRARTALPQTSVEVLDRSLEEMIGAIEKIDRARYAHLADLRLAPPRNDPGFELIVQRYRRRFISGFRSVAYLVKTEAGRLQVMRMRSERDGDANAPVFLDEAKALAFVSATG